MEVDTLNKQKAINYNNTIWETGQNSSKTASLSEPKEAKELHLPNDLNKKEDNFTISYQEISESMLKSAIDDANKTLKYTGRSLEYSIHEKTNRVMVKVIDTNTKEVIREIPPEKSLDIFAKMLELTGLIFDEKR